MKCRSESRYDFDVVTVAIECIEVSNVTMLQTPLKVEALDT